MRPGRRCSALAAALVAPLSAGFAVPVLAHTSQRTFVLTLPTDLYILGGTVVVAVSFVLVGLVPVTNVRAITTAAWRVGRLPASAATVLSLLSLVATIGLVMSGLVGTQDPLTNPLPLTVWILWWVGLTIAHALFGNLWAALNPWHGLYAVLLRAPGLGRWLQGPPLRYPAWLGYWPACVLFLAFAWFELIFTVPQNPEILAQVVGIYVTGTFAAVLLFGKDTWLRYGEAFSVFFRIVSWLSPLNARPEEESGRIAVAFPGAGLLHVHPLPPSGVAFVLLVLATVSFDGLSETFWWLGSIGVNPLAFPGRSAVAWSNTLGLLAAFGVLGGGYVASVWLGQRLAGQKGVLAETLGVAVASIVPIALGYHFAHYLTVFLVDAQYTAIAFNDPFGRGWDLLGLRHAHATTSFLNNYDSVRLIWHCQIAAIVIVHVLAVLVAHFLAARRFAQRRAAILSQAPLTLLMIAYTLFGLWLLSTAAVG